jgi:hypothetical protein
MFNWNNLKRLLAVLAVFLIFGAVVVLNRPSAEQKNARYLRETRLQFALNGAVQLRNRTQDPKAVQFLSVQILGDDGPVCYTFRVPNGSAVEQENAILNDDFLLQTGQPRFDAIWHNTCVSKSGEELAPDIALRLQQYDQSQGH